MKSLRNSALVITLLLAAIAAAQDKPFSISLDVAAVTVEAVVRDSGRILTDLTRDDFEVYEDGRRQEISSFVGVETPRSILLLFDISGSTDGQRPFMVQATNVFLANMKAQDRIALASFAQNLQMIMNWRSREGKSQDVKMPAPQFYSNVYSALEDAVSKFKNEKARKGLVVMTDGRDTPALEDMLRQRRIPELETDSGFRKLVQNLKKQEIPIYFIALNTDRNPSPSVNGQEAMRIAAAMGPPAAEKYVESVRRRMEHIADVTGGRILFPRTLADVVPLYLAIGAELGASYGLSYSPSNPVKDGKFRRIEVRVRKEGVKVTQSRDGYPAN